MSHLNAGQVHAESMGSKGPQRQKNRYAFLTTPVIDIDQQSFHSQTKSCAIIFSL